MVDRRGIDIAVALADLMRENYGHGPEGGTAEIVGDVVVVVLEEAFSPAELKLIELGKSEEVQYIRRTWQNAMAQDFKQIVERETGREVRAFISDTDIAAEVSIEVFVLGAAKTDMDSFEGKDSTAPHTDTPGSTLGDEA